MIKVCISDKSNNVSRFDICKQCSKCIKSSRYIDISIMQNAHIYKLRTTEILKDIHGCIRYNGYACVALYGSIHTSCHARLNGQLACQCSSANHASYRIISSDTRTEATTKRNFQSARGCRDRTLSVAQCRKAKRTTKRGYWTGEWTNRCPPGALGFC